MSCRNQVDITTPRMPSKSKKKYKGGGVNAVQTEEGEGESSASRVQEEQEIAFQDHLNNENIEEYLPNYQAEWFSMVIKAQVKKHIPEFLQQQQLDLEKMFEKKWESMQQENSKLHIEIEEKLKLAFSKENAVVKKRLDEVEEDNRKKQRRIERLEYMINQRDAKIKELKMSIDELEQQHYMKEVQIVGIQESESDEEDLKRFLNMAKAKMGQKLKKTDVEHIHRLGKKSEKKSRDVIIKFKEKTVRDTFYQNRKKLIIKNDTKNSIYVNDHLTHYRKGLLYSARQLCKAKKVTAAWSQQGNILVRKSDNDSIKQIKSYEDLEEFNNRGYKYSRSDEETMDTDSTVTVCDEELISHLGDDSY